MNILNHNGGSYSTTDIYIMALLEVQCTILIYSHVVLLEYHLHAS